MTPEALAPKPGHNYLLKLELSMQRLLVNPLSHAYIVDHTALTGPEGMVFDMVCKRIKAQLTEKASGTQEDIDNVLSRAVDILGKRGLLRICFEPLLVMGVPYYWFVAIAVACLGLFVISQQFVVVLAAPLIHLAAYLYYRHNRDHLFQEKMSKLLSEGVMN